MTSIAHPVLRGQPATRTVSRRAIPGTAMNIPITAVRIISSTTLGLVSSL